ncbi:hypothetical protein BRD13_06230 [Halobacteriales archaeon SW_5_70_135]|nr:MAG: hypothetical protein BRD13_06230 [Halobacteriales archaeon SW_5_70_135]
MWDVACYATAERGSRYLLEACVPFFREGEQGRPLPVLSGRERTDRAVGLPVLSATADRHERARAAVLI